MSKVLLNRIGWLFVFGISMAFMESAVVVYLREIYYPEGFSFPLQPIDYHIGITEIYREIATILMLVTVGIIAGRNRVEKFAFFIYLFAVWDIFYYVFLKMLLNWPASLLTWDVLFLIPFTWTGPVIGPVFNSITMLLIAIMLVYLKEKNGSLINFKVLLYWLIAGSLPILIAYMTDYINFMLNTYSFLDLLRISKYDELVKTAENFIPVKFNWWLFFSGNVIQYFGIIQFYIRNK